MGVKYLNEVIIVRLIKVLFTNFSLLVITFISSSTILAQPNSVIYTEQESLNAFYVLPRCIQLPGPDGCFAVVLQLPEGFIAEYSAQTRNRIMQGAEDERYNRSRSRNVYVLSFPPQGGYLELEKPGSTVVETGLHAEPREAGSVVYYTVREVPYSQILAARSTARAQPAAAARDAAVTTNRNEPPRSGTTGSVTPADQKDYRSEFLWSFDYSNITRTHTDLFRSSSLSDATEGYMFSFILYYLDGFRSARAGVTVAATSARVRSEFGNQYNEEYFRYSHVSVFASYMPSFSIAESRTTLLSLYTDFGVSGMLTNFYYEDYQEFEDQFFIEFTEEIYEIDEVWLPGFNLGAGLLFNYKQVGLHVGVLMESAYVVEFGTLISSVYPKIGITIRYQ